jgi:hypothetical protein
MQNASAQSDAQSASSGSRLYMLERFDIGPVPIDRQLRVVGMNDYAPEWKSPRDPREPAAAGKRLLRKIPTTRQRRPSG